MDKRDLAKHLPFWARKVLVAVVFLHIIDASNNNKYHGIIPRAAEYIFESIQQHKKTASHRSTFTIRANFVEIYNEQANDLLNLQATNLPVRWSNRDGFFVENLFIVECASFADLMAVVQEGVSNRKVSAHELNKDSSRSHSIFTVYFDIQTVDLQDGYTSSKYGRVHFVDLAGSERLKESKSKGANAIETGHINKSLLTLGKVIRVLSESQGKQQWNSKHIPYRDSKLTQLLMDALGGNSKTIMVCERLLICCRLRV